ncbi:MAG: DUF2793 domain-containing protein [Rhodobiaceae bacterium]|nr:DUF2793 domain-containing protein [Rhodobiaceae bacterium]
MSAPTTPNLSLPLIASAQAQKHVTHNDALAALDALVQISVADRDTATPPPSVAEGARYIVAAGAEGVWSGHDGELAVQEDGGWRFFAPQAGWTAWIADEGILAAWDGSSWAQVAGTPNPVGLVGINTLADATNKLSVKSDAILFSHDDVTPGTGSVQHKLNKASPGDTGSVLYQTGYSGRAEIGLCGNDDFHFKVSPDGTNWNEALILDKDDGKAAFPAGTKHALTGAATNMLIQTPGGTGVTSIWRFDAPRTGIPRYATLDSVSGDTITLTEARANEFFNNQSMEGVSYVRIWNASKSPEQSAWLRAGAATPWAATSDLYVTDASDISGWASGDTIRLGEPIGGTVASPNCAAVDISQMMQAYFGKVFKQSGLFAALTASTDGTSGGWAGHVAITPDGSSGSFMSAYTPSDGSLVQTFAPCGSSSDSPISDSRLIYVRELDDGAGTLNVGAVSVVGVFV